MSCNGCRVLRKGCRERCILRSCLHWISSPEAQANATLFLAKFFGRSDLMSLISAVPEPQRSALFQSLLFEACGRTVNPVNGSVGLLWSGNWQVCQAAVETVLAGGTLRPLTGIDTGRYAPNYDESSESFSNMHDVWSPSKPSMRVVGKPNQSQGFVPRPALDTKWIAGRSGKSRKRGRDAMSFRSEESDTTSLGINGGARKKLLNLFV